MSIFTEETKYQKHFKSMLKDKAGNLEGDPVAGMSEADKKEFFGRVDDSWRSKEEAKKSGKKSGPTGKGKKDDE